MNKIAKILSVVLSASIALTVAVVTLVSALAADTPVFSLNKVSETDKEIVVSINLESGKFNNATFEFVTSKNITACTKIEKGAALKGYLMDYDNLMTASKVETTRASMAFANEDKSVAFDKAGQYYIYTFSKASSADVTKDDLTLKELDLGTVEIKNNLPVAVVVETTTEAPVVETTTEKPAETTTAAEVETTTEAEVETTTEAEVETTTEAEVETTTEAEVETTTEAVVEDETTTEAEVLTTEAIIGDETTTEAVVEDDTTAEATVETTAVVEDGTTAEAVVVNPNTGDSATASAAIVALLAISGAAVVALRKKED